MAPERKRPTRSQLYQHLLVEKSFSHDMMSTFPMEDSLYKKLNPFEYDERILDLEDQLKERFWEIIEENLTKRQLEIVNLLKGGATQSEAAHKLGVNQSSITKCLSSDTIIYLDNSFISIKDIYSNKANYINNLYIRCINEDTGRFTKTKIVNVMCGKEKQLIRIITNYGKTIRASADHKFFTNNGWARLEDIISKDIMVSTDCGKDIISFEKIKEWKYDGNEETYDIEVGGPWHNFIAGGFIVHNSIHGNVDYSDKNNGKTSYGGVCKKLLKIIDQDPVIKEIKDKIAEIRNSTWI